MRSEVLPVDGEHGNVFTETVKTHSLYIPVFGWHVRYFQLDGKPDVPAWKRFHVDSFGENGNLERYLPDFSGNGFGGYHEHDTVLRTSLITINYPPDKKVLMRLLAHECRHVVDTLLETLEIDDVETPAYVAGYVGEGLMLPVLEKNRKNKLF